MFSIFAVGRKQYSDEQRKLKEEAEEWLNVAPKWLVIWLPEPNEGKEVSPAAAIKNINKEDVLNICRGRHLGVMGYDLSESDLVFYPEPLVEEFEKSCGLKRFNNKELLITALDKNEIHYIPCHHIPSSESIMMQEKYLKTKRADT